MQEQIYLGVSNQIVTEFSSSKYLQSKRSKTSSHYAKSQRNLLKKRRISIGKRPIWLSGIFSQGSYQWDNKAKSSVDDDFQAWLPGQPDNLENNEECLMMNPKGRWNDLNCNSQAYVICKNALIVHQNCFVFDKKYQILYLLITLITLTILGWCWCCG